METTLSYTNQIYAGDTASAPIGSDDMRKMFTAKRYAHSDGLYWGSPETCDALQSGFYMPLMLPGIGPALKRVDTKTDNLLRLPDPICDMLLNEFCLFWDKSALMGERGLTVKRGLLLYGPPGSGKTSAVQLMAHHMIREMNGIVVIVDHPQVTAAALQLLRQLEPDRPVILLYEDIDALVERHSESGLLALLDGELQVGNVVNVATTNYPERLDTRFTDRPGRFDRITLVGMPEAPARAAYFEAKAPDVPQPRRERWVLASDGWSIAHLRELVVAHLVLGEDDEEVIKRLTGMREQLPKSSDANESSFGFHSNASLQRDARRQVAGRGRY
jgi:energy-coupling factor transporter ATP-binding protein EcfA2